MKLIRFLFLTLAISSFHPCHLVSQANYPVMNDSSCHNLKAYADSINLKIKRLQDAQLKQEIEFAKQHIERANLIINWSALILTLLAILLAIAGVFGFTEFSKIKKIGKEMREELDKIKEQKDGIIKETKLFMNVTYYLNAGMQAYSSGDYVRARELFYIILESQPNHIQAYNRIGRCLKMENKLNEAINIFKKVIEMNPDDADAYYGLGICYGEIDKNQAIVNYQKAIELNPKHTSALNRLGTIYRLENLEKALECYLKAGNIKKSSVTSFNAGLIFYVKEDFEFANRYFNEVKFFADQEIERAKAPHWAYHYKAIIEGLHNDISESKRLYHNALSYNNSTSIRLGMKSDLDFLLTYVKNKSNIEVMISYLGDDI